MICEKTSVILHESFQGEYRLIGFRAPQIAASAGPGQFVHVRIARMDAAALRRPFSIYRAEGGEIHVMYKAVGRGTEVMLSARPGDEFSLIGPLGKGFRVDVTETYPVFVAGGYGVAPLSFLARKLPRPGTIFLGGRTSRDILCEQEFRDAGWGVEVATQDGSRGRKGLVTDALDAWIAAGGGGLPPEFFACGPNGMLKAVGDRAMERGWTAWLSLDNHMGCGVGACLACVQRIRDTDGHEEWLRVCREGPVFESRQIVWRAGDV